MPKTETLNLLGVSSDKPDYAVPPKFWTEVQNIEIESEVTKRARGHLAVFGTPLHVARWLQYVSSPLGEFWLYVGDTQVSQTRDTEVHVDLTGTLVFDSTNDLDPITGGVINGHVVFNNEDGVAASWNPGDVAALALPDWPTDRRAGAVRIFRDFIIAMNITDGAVAFPEQLRWSDAAPAGDVPQSWTAGVGSLAGDAQVAYQPGRIIDGLAQRDSFMVYKRHSTFVLNLVGGSLVMQTKPVFPTLGVLAKNCVVEYRGQHFMLTDGDFVIHNGVEVRSIVQARVRNAIFDAISGVNFGNTYIALDNEQAEIWVCVPREPGDVFPTIAAIYSIPEDQWTLRDLPVPSPHVAPGIIIAAQAEPTWDTRTTTWNTDGNRWNTGGATGIEEHLLVADTGPKFHAVGFADDFDGVDPIAIARRTGLDFGMPDIVKFCSAVWPKIDGVNGSIIEIRAGGSLGAETPITYGPTQNFVIGTDDFVGAEASGRFLAFEFRSTTSAIWRMASFDVELDLLGQHG